MIYINDEIYDKLRYIEYNGTSSKQHDLIMSGATPLSIDRAKLSEVDLPYHDGTLDTSCAADGHMHFHNREVTYTFVYMIKRDNKRIDDLNKELDGKISAIEQWIYSAKRNSADGLIGTTFYDSGWGYSLSGAYCTNMSVAKTFGTEFWFVRFDISFSMYPRSHTKISNTAMSDVESPVGDRVISYASTTSREMGLIMHSTTPLSIAIPKTDKLDAPVFNGDINTNYTKDVNPNLAYRNLDAKNQWYQDRKISYTFSFLKRKELNMDTEWMNRIMQNKVDDVVTWMYKDTKWYEDSVSGIVACGAGALADSGLEGYYIFARCSNISVQKMISNDWWGLIFTLEFKVYPYVAYGEEGKSRRL